MAPEYSSQAYWDARYGDEAVIFEWYHGWHTLQHLLLQHFPLHARILQVGVGTSELQLHMVTKAGYTSITNTDFSSAVIKHMSARHADYHHQLVYTQSDCRSMVEFADGQFDCVLDKGTMDAIMCGDDSHQHAASMMQEIHRVLNNTGVFMEISYGTPDTRLPHLHKPDLRWRVQVYVMRRNPTPPPTNLKATQHNDNGDDIDDDILASLPPPAPVSIEGPFDASDDDLMLQLQEHTDVHFVYVCTKQE